MKKRCHHQKELKNKLRSLKANQHRTIVMRMKKMKRNKKPQLNRSRKPIKLTKKKSLENKVTKKVIT
jgi:hypothetical protein